ncbi:ABC-three component system protein [Cryobacterium sp. MLB-32]|uniref:ABC-three component system protein n=1 Tax=Cryobacterium sp. MLB-32 TaxID=1529318 RepID=UPI0012E0A7B8|nr:ABC-three component system protein [Cryobacterium sp. MLB-32]
MAQTSARDRVPPAQEKVVIARSGNKCAYPGCNLDLTIDPKVDGDRPKATGKVAHIAAASPGGPRYDPNMTSVERGSAQNLIYLCGPHHDAVDAQLGYHTREFLTDNKRAHEEAVARAVRNALGDVTYEELMVVCAVIASTPATPQQLGVELALPLQEKIDLNKLGSTSVQRITDGLSQTVRVEGFIGFQNSVAPSFGRSLVARFKSDYYAARAENLEPDAVFDYLVDTAIENAGPRDTPQIRAAALAVIAYLFEICEIFEHE